MLTYRNAKDELLQPDSHHTGYQSVTKPIPYRKFSMIHSFTLRVGTVDHLHSEKKRLEESDSKKARLHHNNK